MNSELARLDLISAMSSFVLLAGKFRARHQTNGLIAKA